MLRRERAFNFTKQASPYKGETAGHTTASLACPPSPGLGPPAKPSASPRQPKPAATGLTSSRRRRSGPASSSLLPSAPTCCNSPPPPPPTGRKRRGGARREARIPLSLQPPLPHAHNGPPGRPAALNRPSSAPPPVATRPRPPGRPLGRVSPRWRGPAG